MDVVPTDETPLSDPPAAQPETKPITSTEVDQAASQSSFKNEETPPGFFSSGSLQPSSSADSASTSRSTLSPDSVGDCDSEDGRIAAEEFGMVEALPSYSEGDVLEGRIKGPGNSAYRIYRKGSDKDPFYYMLKTKSSAIEGEVDLDAESYGTKNIGVTKKGQIKSFAGVVCKTGTLGLAPIEWKTNKNGNYIRPCHRIKVNWRAGDQVIPSWEKRGTIKRYWLDAGYMDPSNNPTMEVTNDVKIHDSVVLKEGQTIEKLSFAILKAAIRCDKNYALAQANDRSRRSVTPNFPQDSDHEM
ncbi:hypothetical protein CEP54_016335 [Fusarium duplospermum]|uniref:Uncharacterized protein n=1 Tax=Fusarium duplospermum TaxID=1325734 RepID=A0A428NF58_9HYPO|nr:hypothetical protein CEP54_016335 [Fusarium duplospermum]